MQGLFAAFSQKKRKLDDKLVYLQTFCFKTSRRFFWLVFQLHIKIEATFQSMSDELLTLEIVCVWWCFTKNKPPPSFLVMNYWKPLSWESRRFYGYVHLVTHHCLIGSEYILEKPLWANGFDNFRSTLLKIYHQYRNTGGFVEQIVPGDWW